MESLKQQWIYRSRRLLYSLNELEREAEESKLIAKLAVSERGRGSGLGLGREQRKNTSDV